MHFHLGFHIRFQPEYDNFDIDLKTKKMKLSVMLRFLPRREHRAIRLLNLTIPLNFKM